MPWRDDWADGHYVVLVGLDSRFLYAMDPSVSAGYAYVPIPEFVERWHDVETRGGKVRKYVHAAIFIRGTSPLRAVPAPLARME